MKEPSKKKTRPWQAWTPLMLAAMLVVGIAVGAQLQSGGLGFSYNGIDKPIVNGFGQGKLEELLRYIEAKYVDPVEKDELIEEAVGHMLKQLDPHSTYLSVERVQAEAERLGGNFEGIGVEFMLYEDTIRVVATVPGGPSEKAGVWAGDNIVTIEDSLVAGVGLENDEIMDRLRGGKGSQVRVGILRHGEDALRQITIVRDQIPMNSVDAAYMIEPEIGYVRINRFSATTAQEFNTHLRGMVDSAGMKDIIVDLRQNPGGYLRSATDILSQFFTERNKLLVYTEGRASQREEWKTTGRALFNIRNVVVLIDESSASASEIVAGAIQDYDRGVIVGRPSYGKGLVQEQYFLSDGAAIRLTVSRYYIPSGRSIQKAYDDPIAYAHRNVEAFQVEEAQVEEDSLPLIDTLAFYTASGRKVYGGGGIKPDIQIPVDSSYMSPDVFRLQIEISPFVFLNLHRFKEQYQGLDIEAFRTQFQAGEELFRELLDFAKSKGEEIDEEEVRQHQDVLSGLIKSRIAKQLYDNEAQFRVLNEQDRDVKRALEVLHKPNPLSEAGI